MLSIVGPRAFSSMKIPTPRVQLTQHVRQVHQPPGEQIPHIVLALPDAIHPQQCGSHHLLALLLYQAGPDDDVDIAGFVFERHEHDPLGRSWPLAHGDDAAAAGELSVTKRVQVCSRDEAHLG